MRLTTRSTWLGAAVILIGVLAAGATLFPGCSPAPQPTPPEEEPQPVAVQPTAEPEGPAAEPEEPAAEPEEPAAEPEEPAAEPPVVDASKVSTFAPAEDLVGQVGEYLERLEKAIESEEEYNDCKEKISKDANTLIVIALALGLHDEDHELKAGSLALMKAAQDLATTEDYEAAKKSVGKVKEASEPSERGHAGATDLKWEKVASLPELMKQVPLINTKLKRYTKGARFKSKAKDSAGFSAVIAVIAQGTMANSGETEKPDEVEKWEQFSVQMRNAAAAVNAAIHASDEAAAAAAMERLAQSCDDCHVVFHPEEEEE